ncbi:hypothetical protein Q5H92_13170 [Hymenobacter sp. M29]|uniref:Lipoprotein n=1 Tax=Hymenobacter mellowenesis TaxID=3063995 RepID=A0ABT9ABU1_9BACT|nr:hypothetical protein [Hymenobacter sp. M29]MDO7847317.1 hypothetical protein [Hymenobacter sp. M29]
MLAKWSFLLAVSSTCCASCSSSKREPLQITVTECVDGFPTQEYDLTTQTMRVHNSQKPDAMIRFTLTAAERETIENKYDELGMERVDKASVLEKECGQIPMPCRTLRVVRGTRTQKLFIRTACGEYTEDGKRTKTFLYTIMRIVEEKAEVKRAAGSDQMFL